MPSVCSHHRRLPRALVHPAFSRVRSTSLNAPFFRFGRFGIGFLVNNRVEALKTGYCAVILKGYRASIR